MFGISAPGWLHTLGSLPAIPAAVYMLARHGRIVPRSAPGTVYLISMVIGALTVFPVAHQPVSNVVAIVTLFVVLLGYGVGRLPGTSGAKAYIETISLSVSVFLLMVPTVSEILRRVPDGHPLVTDLKSPLLLSAQGSLALALVAGVAAQVIWLRRQRQRSVRS